MTFLGHRMSDKRELITNLWDESEEASCETLLLAHGTCQSILETGIFGGR